MTPAPTAQPQAAPARGEASSGAKPPGRSKDTKHSYASKDPSYDWRTQVVWVHSHVAKDECARWMRDSGHKWADVWWEHDRFLKMAQEHRGLIGSKAVTTAMFEAVGQAQAVRFNGWTNIGDVIGHMTKQGKLRGLLAFDVFAAGIGSTGLPADMSFAQVVIPGKRGKGFSTTVFMPPSVAFVQDLAAGNHGANQLGL